jgi:hypothetical protein
MARLRLSRMHHWASKKNDRCGWRGGQGASCRVSDDRSPSQGYNSAVLREGRDS